LKLSSEICALDLQRKIVRLAGGDEFSAVAGIVIATGVKRRKLDVGGEEEFIGKGIVESGARDRNSVKGKTAAIVGGGDAAFENALILAGETEEKAAAAKNVYLICRGADFRARAEFVKRVSAHPKIEILTETIVREIGGGEGLEFVRLENLRTKKNFKLPIEALLIRAGVEPNTGIFRGKLDLDEQEFIKIDSSCQTNVKGVFAVGDVASPLAPTLSGAVGMGATAVKTIREN
jgi:thioredoxin reductase (NADPH)